MRSLQAHFGWFSSAAINDIVDGQHRKSVEHYLAFLRAEGIVETIGEERHGPILHLRQRIVRDGDAPPARRSEGAQMGLRQQALWTAMRSLKTFTPAELAYAASTDALPIGSDTARSYVRDLKLAGYVAPLAGTAYRLMPARNTGPRAPIVLRAEQAAFDLNLMQAVNVTASEIGRVA
jgi:hypothetical protein